MSCQLSSTINRGKRPKLKTQNSKACSVYILPFGKRKLLHEFVLIEMMGSSSKFVFCINGGFWDEDELT